MTETPSRWIRVSYFGQLPEGKTADDLELTDVSGHLAAAFGFTGLAHITAAEAPQERDDAEPRATALALLERMRDVRGHIEDMSDEERIFMLGALTGALESALAS